MVCRDAQECPVVDPKQRRVTSNPAHPVATSRPRKALMKPAKKATQKSSKGTTATGKKPKGFTDEERAAMRERLQELKTNGESAVLEKIAALPQPDRAMAERLHAIIKANAPTLPPRTWYGMPAYAKDGNVICFFQSA